MRIRCASGPLWEIHERGLDLPAVRRLMFVDRVTTCAHCSVHVPDVLLLGGSMAWEAKLGTLPAVLGALQKVVAAINGTLAEQAAAGRPLTKVSGGEWV